MRFYVVTRNALRLLRDAVSVGRTGVRLAVVVLLLLAVSFLAVNTAAVTKGVFYTLF